jgi:hypothetical protein
MRFHPVARVATAVLLVVVVIASVIVARLREAHGLTLLQVFLGVVFLMLAAATLEVFGVAHRLVPGGIERVVAFRQPVIIHWADVVAIGWSANVRWYELRSSRGERLRVDQRLTAMDSFARAALEGIPGHVLDRQPGLRQQLENAARGLAPPDERDRGESVG